MDDEGDVFACDNCHKFFNIHELKDDIEGWDYLCLRCHWILDQEDSY